MKFSANLGFLWTDRPLDEAIRAAKAARFHAVECHWPYDIPASRVRASLEETGFEMLGINTRRGDPDKGDNGLAAIPDRQDEARASIDEALTYAVQISAPNVHVMAGFAAGEEAHATFVANLEYSCEQAARNGLSILIEPLNHYDAPGYFLTSTNQAIEIIKEVGADNLRLMFDCYHVQLMEGDLTNRIRSLLPHIGHIQFASVPDRGAPDHGEVDYSHIFAHIEALGYEAPLGAEYKPVGETDASIGWLDRFSNAPDIDA